MNKESNLNDMLSYLRSYDEFIICDTESTGFQPNATNEAYTRLIEVSAIKVKDGVVVEEFSKLINPGIKISKKITEITKITNEMVKDAPFYQTVLKEFYEFCEKDTVPMVFHNAPHDLKFLNYFGEKAGGYKFGTMTVDTLKLAREYLKGRKSYKLNVLCDEFGIQFEGHHRALNDSYATFKVLNALVFNIGELQKDLKNANIILSLEPDNPQKTPQEFQCDILRCSYWEKSFSSKQMKRIYVLISHGADKANVFYDFNSRDWGIKDNSFEQPIQFSIIQDKLMNQYEMVTEKQFNDAERWRELC